MVGVCLQCNKGLSQYNLGNLCFACQEKKQGELMVKMGDSPHYGIDDICFMLQLSPEQVKRLGRNGKIPGKIPGIRKHMYLRTLVDQWVRSGHKLLSSEERIHYSKLALTALKLAEILGYYYKADRFSIVPTTSSDFPFTVHLAEMPSLSKHEFSNLMDHLKGEIPELVSIAEYPSACKQYFAGNRKLENGVPTANITGDLILKLKLMANPGNFTGRCPDCPS